MSAVQTVFTPKELLSEVTKNYRTWAPAFLNAIVNGDAVQSLNDGESITIQYPNAEEFMEVVTKIRRANQEETPGNNRYMAVNSGTLPQDADVRTARQTSSSKTKSISRRRVEVDEDISFDLPYQAHRETRTEAEDLLLRVKRDLRDLKLNSKLYSEEEYYDEVRSVPKYQKGSDDYRFKKDYDMAHEREKAFRASLSVLWTVLTSNSMTPKAFAAVKADPSFATLIEPKRDTIGLWLLIKKYHSDVGSETADLLFTKLEHMNDGQYSTFEEFVVDWNHVIAELAKIGQAPADAHLNRMFKHKIDVTKSRAPVFSNWLAGITGAIPYNDVIARMASLKEEARAQMARKQLISGINGNSNGNSQLKRGSSLTATPAVVMVSATPDDEQVCFNCNAKGHKARNCPLPKKTCALCDMAGHSVQSCYILTSNMKRIREFLSVELAEAKARRESNTARYSNRSSSAKPKSKPKRTVPHQAMVTAMSNGDTAADDSLLTLCPLVADDKYDYTVDYDLACSAIGEPATLKTLDNIQVLSDGCASLTVFGQLEMIPNAQQLNEPFYIGGMGAKVIITHRGVLPLIGEVFFSPQAKHNVISHWTMLKLGYKIVEVLAGIEWFDSTGESLLYFKRGRNGCCSINYKEIISPDVYACALVESLVGGKEYFSKVELDRAAKVMALHFSLGHPNDKALTLAIQNSELKLTSRDVDNYKKIYGHCSYCWEAKMKEDSAKPSESEPAHEVGGNIHIDLKRLKMKAIGGFIETILCFDEYTGYASLIGLSDKTADSVYEGLKTLIGFYKSKGHSVKKLTCDSESTLLCAVTLLGHEGVDLQASPPGRHEKFAERHIQTHAGRCRAVLAALIFEPPEFLYFELMKYVMQVMNMVPNKLTGNISPYEVVCRVKPNIAVLIPYGTPVMAKEPNVRGSKSARGRFGIIVGISEVSPGSFRVYFPDNHTVGTRMQCNVMDSYPANLTWRERIIDNPLEARPLYALNDMAVESLVGEGAASPILEAVEDLDELQEHDHFTRSKSVQDPLLVAVADDQRMSITKALKSERKSEAEVAIWKEIHSLISLDVFKFTKFVDIPKQHRNKVMTTLMFMKVKYKSDGSFDKMKGRLCVDGSHQDWSTYHETSSKTIHPSILNYQLDQAVQDSANVYCYDITSAFCKTNTGEEELYVQIEPAIAKIIIDKFPQFESFIERNGKIYAQLNAYLYGTKQASYEFQKKLTFALIEGGFIQNPSDPCNFYYKDGTGYIVSSWHVDDSLVTCTSPVLLSKFEAVLTKHFGEFNKQSGPKLSFLNRTIDILADGTIFVDKFGYQEDLLKRIDMFNCKPTGLPHTTDLLSNNESKPTDTRLYLSIVMGLMYLARMLRLDILFTVVYLATRCNNPTENDLTKAKKVVRYINDTMDYGIHYIKHDSNIIKIYCDASHGIHADMKGHSGIIVTLGGAPIWWHSGKQSVVSLSSTEAEINAMKEALTFLEWFSTAISIFNLEKVEIVLFQDNESAITIATKGGTWNGTKHYMIRAAYCHDVIISYGIKVLHLSTINMDADLLTKNLSKELFERHRSKLIKSKQSVQI